MSAGYNISVRTQLRHTMTYKGSVVHRFGTTARRVRTHKDIRSPAYQSVEYGRGHCRNETGWNAGPAKYYYYLGSCKVGSIISLQTEQID